MPFVNQQIQDDAANKIGIVSSFFRLGKEEHRDSDLDAMIETLKKYTDGLKDSQKSRSKNLEGVDFRIK